ncbi:chemotaxis protein CheD [Agrobacterium vitis]|nr:chemotaxis protein CheD [Agrobacterium vitis]MBE1438779.1 chemotaxis protein CheD [Agrobacterium vitis]
MALNWDTDVGTREGRALQRVSISQGEYAVADDPDVVITTVLGSCVAACIRDPQLGIGGMNHFVLPGPTTSRVPVVGDPSRYGFYLMNVLIDELLSRGAKLHRLEAKLFGGASPCNSYYNVGEKNAIFALKFLAEKRITVTEQKFGGPLGCKLEYWPVSGKVVHTQLKRTIGHKAPVINLKRVLPL